MNLTTRGMVAAEVSLPEVKKVDVTSWKCHRLPWNCGEKVLPEQLVIACTQMQIHEVWHFAKHQRRTGLFKDYVNKWLKIKQESSGWPSWCKKYCTMTLTVWCTPGMEQKQDSLLNM